MDNKYIHESAHCIAAIIYEIAFDKVTMEITASKITNNNKDADSVIITQPNVTFNNFVDIKKEQKIILALSGSVAESIITKERMDNFPFKNPQTEFTIIEKAKEFLTTRNTDDYKLYLENAESVNNIDKDTDTTIDLMKRNWANIIILAKYLEKNKTITFNEVNNLIEINR